ncbi:MAG: helix-hairpin-helix domain-containing protein [Piscinibacter sp.]|uniref:helix-hairpin-helix domain-containing protein n=1 Tax=Piscinibacter sp. TaxID=1903157 RepID=UPI003D0D41AD
MDNPAVAALLREMAELLQAQGEENAFRIAAYRHAADTVTRLERPVGEILEREGVAGLDALPTIGAGIAAAIAEMVQTGHWTKLERLRGGAAPEALLRSVPGVGPRLALQLQEELGIDTLEGLEVAAHDGRLEALDGVGARRAASIRAALTERLDRERAARRRRPAAPADHAPPVELLLEVDRDYRARAAAGTLPTIAPRRFNPDGVAWLPVLHTKRGAWSVTALFSNTARAHELGRVHDWVVLYAEDGAHHERQYTVVTAQRGPLAGRRVVRGREDECRAMPA